jgi:hypothetical protein
VAQAESEPRVTTLLMQPQADGGMRSTLERGIGPTLDDQSTLAQTRTEPTDDQVQLAEVAGNLASRSGFDPEAAMREYGASFVLLTPAPGDGREAIQTEARARTALDANSALVPVGETEYGTLWRFAGAEPDAAAARIPADAGGWPAGLITALQLLVIGGALLLSIPTGAGREADRRPVRRRPTRRRPPRSGAAATAAAADAAPTEAASDDDPSAAASDDVSHADRGADTDSVTDDEPEAEPSGTVPAPTPAGRMPPAPTAVSDAPDRDRPTRGAGDAS